MIYFLSCECPESYEGPHCETIDVGFNGDGWAWYPPLQACDKATLSLELQANKPDGLVFYVGPLAASTGVRVQGEFILLSCIVDAYFIVKEILVQHRNTLLK